MVEGSEKKSKSHLYNLEEIVKSLVWWINYDTILTELRFDLEYLGETDIEKFVDYCYQVCSKDELQEGKFPINRAVVEHFVNRLYTFLSQEKKTRKIDEIIKEIHRSLNIPIGGPISLSTETIGKILDDIERQTGEGPLEKVKKRIKVAVALQWLQDKELSGRLSKPTQEYIYRLGEFYGRYKKGELVDSKTIGAYQVPPEDLKKLEEDYASKLSIAIYVATSDIEKAKKSLSATPNEKEQFRIIVDAVTRIKNYIEGKADKSYDYVERFKDTLFVAIIINYLQDRHVERTEATSLLLKWVVPLYSRYKEASKR